MRSEWLVLLGGDGIAKARQELGVEAHESRVASVQVLELLSGIGACGNGVLHECGHYFGSLGFEPGVVEVQIIKGKLPRHG